MSEKKPSTVLPLSPTSTRTPMPNFILDPSIKGLSFDQLINNRGINFRHRKAVPCPNLRSLDDNTHHPECPFCDNSGILYYEEKSIIGVFAGNSLERLFEQQGMWEIGTAVVTFPAEYVDGTQADFNEYDQLVVDDFEMRLWELKEYEPRTDNLQRLRYPTDNIEYLASVESNTLTLYTVDVDYTIEDNKIKWINKPAYDSVTERGSVFVASYFANPVYVVVQTLRELRVTQEYVNGQKIARRLPQEVLVKKDFLPQKAEKIQD